MPALPRPDLPPGAHRDLGDALHELHHRAGWPSLRTLAKAAGCSHTTVSSVFSGPKLPVWGILELVVEAMDGDIAQFHRLWLEAGVSASDLRPPPRLAGRSEELSVVRRHLASATGMLVVTGEAGMGKSRLVTAAVEAADTPVAFGACLPLSQTVPMMPVADALAAASAVDHGRRVDDVVAGGSAYLRPSLARLLPELEEGVSPDPDQRQVFLAVERLLASGLALVLDDLHWADPATLDLIEHLLARAAPVTLLGTWRLDDPTVAEPTRDWWQRVRRLPTTAILALGPLDRSGSAEQIEQLGVVAAPGVVDQIYARSGGQPLFTEQLAVHRGTELPDLLADLLDRRLADLGTDASLVATRLGLADRPLAIDDLAAVTGLPEQRLDAALHELADRYLLDTSSAEIALRHPLLAVAARARLLPHEQKTAHRRLAEHFGAVSAAPAAEVAEHWRAAEDPAQELVWRQAAARAAAARVAKGQAATEWLRVLELWPARGSAPAEHADVVVEAMRCLGTSGRIDEAVDLVPLALQLAESLASEEHRSRTASLYLWAAEVTGVVRSTDLSIPLWEQALERLEQLPPSRDLVKVLSRMSGHLRGRGAYADAAVLVRRAVGVGAHLAEPALLYEQLVLRAWDETMAGDLRAAAATIRETEALDLEGSQPDPVWVGVLRTEMLLLTEGSLIEFRAVAEPALDFMRTEELESFSAYVLLSNVVQALVHAGLVGEAAELIDPVTQDGTLRLDRWPVFIERAHLDVLRGDYGHARAAVRLVDDVRINSVGEQVERTDRCARVELWSGDASAAAVRLARTLEVVRETEASRHSGSLLLLATRAAADETGGRPDSEAVGRLIAQRRAMAHDPLASGSVVGAHVAQAAQWEAELARVAGRPDIAAWKRATSEWDRLHRPHDAAYCRLRGAQAALETDHGILAQRLLTRAARDAREHVPLSNAIAGTAAYAAAT